MPAEPIRLPRRFVVTILVLCLAPAILNGLGVSFELHPPTDSFKKTVQAEWQSYPKEEQNYLQAYFQFFDSPYFRLRGEFVHSLLEWTSFCLAIVTAVCAFSHYSIKRDVATPIIGTALLFSGLLDAFHVLVVDKLILFVINNQEFIPFTWAMSRIFHAFILTVGTGIFVWGRPTATVTPKLSGERLIILVSIFWGLFAYLLIHICAVAPRLPQTIFPGQLIPRPYDAIALVIYLFGGGILFPRFHRLHPSLFSHGLLVSLYPYLLSQAYAAFASDSEYNNALNISQYLKIVAHVVPLAGLIFDFSIAFQAEAVLRSTEEKLRIAREIQRGLLPQGPPQIPGYDIAGFSSSAGAVGGDYYDFVAMPNGCWGLVIADVSGHDLGASILMSQTRAYLRAEARNRDNVSEIATRLDHFLSHDVRDRRFVSLFFAKLDPARHQLVYAAAGQNAHLFPLDGAVKSLDVTGPLLGVIDERQPSAEFQLQPGELFLAFTDGIAEATSSKGDQFGNGRIFDIVRRDFNKPAEEIITAIETAVLAHRGQLPIEDDVTMLLVKRLP